MKLSNVAERGTGRARWLTCGVLSGVILALSASPTFAANNKDEVRGNVKNGWTVAWGKEVDHIEYGKLAAAMATGTTGAYLSNLLKDSAATLGKEVVIKALKNRGQTFKAGRFEVQAGIATYKHWTMERNLFTGKMVKVPRPNTHQPYVRWRVR